MARVLVVDDNPDILEALDLLLSLHDYSVLTASTVQEALSLLTRISIDLVIQDMNFTQDITSGDEGKSLFYQLRKQQPTLPIILITAWTQLETAIELVKEGAADYLPKPWDDQKLLALVADYVQREKLTEITTSVPSLPANHKSQAIPMQNYIYHSSVMMDLMVKAEKVASADVNVLITGANGAGKEQLADFLHKHSSRADKPFVKVNIGALPAELMEAELFGAEKGAFTGANAQRKGRFEVADGGTLFLDEIGNLSLDGQMKLLRVLQSGEFQRLGSNQTLVSNVRVFCATNADLPAAIQQGAFREDLYYRLNVVELTTPPLVQRQDDIIPLAQHFLGDEVQISDCAKNYLLSYSWPGNVRELQNACQRAKIFAHNACVTRDDLGGSSSLSTTLGRSHSLSEKDLIQTTLDDAQWVIKKAAEALGMSRQSLYRRIEKYQLKPKI